MQGRSAIPPELCTSVLPQPLYTYSSGSHDLPNVQEGIGFATDNEVAPLLDVVARK